MPQYLAALMVVLLIGSNNLGLLGQFPDGSFGNLEARKVLGRGDLRAPLNLANAFEIPVEHCAVAIA